MVARSTVVRIAVGMATRVVAGLISGPSNAIARRLRLQARSPPRHHPMRHPASVAATAAGGIVIGAVMAPRVRAREHPPRRTGKVRPLKVSAVTVGRTVGKTVDQIADRTVAVTTVTGGMAAAGLRVVTAGATTAVRIATTASRR